MLVNIQHPELGIGKTTLAADVAASATSSTVVNNEGFSTNDYVVFGKPGEEKTEIVLLTSATGNTTIGHTTGPIFPHSVRTPVQEIKYNQAKIYSSTTEDGTYSLVATVDLQINEDVTVYDHTAGTSATWYKVKYYNETTEVLSSYSSAVGGTGYTEDSLYTLSEAILSEFGDEKAQEIGRDRLKKLINMSVRKITRELIKVYPSLFGAYTTQTLTAGTDAYNFPTRFLAFKRVDVNFGGSVATDAYKVEDFQDEADQEPDTTYSTYDPRISLRGTQFVIKPNPPTTGGTAFLWYWQYPEAMDEYSDEHGLPFGANDVIVDYCLYRLWRNKNLEKSNSYKGDYKTNIKEYLDFVGQAQQTYTPKKVKVVFGRDLYSDDY